MAGGGSMAGMVYARCIDYARLNVSHWITKGMSDNIHYDN